MKQYQDTLFAFQDPQMEKLDLGRCKARIINYETAARIVETYHYAHRVPSIAVAFGMYVDDTLAGVITYGTIPSPNARAICGEDYRLNVLELTRLFVFDWAGRNSESWFIGQSFSLLEKYYSDYFILISYADTKANHTGYIYQATNWLYTGVSTSAIYTDENGKETLARTAYDSRLGASSKSIFKSLYGNHTKSQSEPKHRYIYFLGSKGKRKKMRKLLRWPVLPYPKSNQVAGSITLPVAEVAP